MYNPPKISDVKPPPPPEPEPPKPKRPWVKPAMQPKQFLETLLLGLGYSLAVAVLLSVVLLVVGVPVTDLGADAEAPARWTAVLSQLAAYPLVVAAWAFATWALVVAGFVVRSFLRRGFPWLP
jgi:Na+-driven multidrug efflux pump